MAKKNMTNEEAREEFWKRGFNYGDVTYSDILFLASLIQYEYENIDFFESPDKMIKTMRVSPKIRFNVGEDGKMSSCFIRCNSHYFKKREAVSFNADGFIGFCGWACDHNAQPVLHAFREFCDYMEDRIALDKIREHCNG